MVTSARTVKANWAINNYFPYFFHSIIQAYGRWVTSNLHLGGIKIKMLFIAADYSFQFWFFHFVRHLFLQGTSDGCLIEQKL